MSEITTATPQETFDHMIGAGAFQWSWWTRLETVNGDTPDWIATLTIEVGEDSEVTKTINHEIVLAAARRFISKPPKYSSADAMRACTDLIFHGDNADFDAASSDELLQFIMLGEIVFG
jgi:hypothetical protein